jgi:hypothetical protein
MLGKPVIVTEAARPERNHPVFDLVDGANRMVGDCSVLVMISA